LGLAHGRDQRSAILGFDDLLRIPSQALHVILYSRASKRRVYVPQGAPLKMKNIPYEVVDVFTGRQFGGNQLAVVTDARGLSGAQMQQIANEFNFSETTFVLPPQHEDNTAHVRIFNRTQEMPFAGHPNVGTAFVMGAQSSIFERPVGQVMRFEEAAGIVTVELLRASDGAPSGAIIAAPRSLEVGKPIEPIAIAKCLGLNETDIILTHHQPISASVGVEFMVAEVAATALSKATPHTDAFAAVARAYFGSNDWDRFSVFFYARAGAGIEKLNARMFAPLSGTFEDPATGSASAAIGALLASLDAEADGHFEIEIAQGVEMGRPSEIRVAALKTKGVVTSVKVSGYCARTMRGVLQID
jgi:trans-2,3-dihydro-3-hydroxyanthranilate isomerase